MRYAICNAPDNTPPQDGAEIAWRAISDDEEPEAFEVIVDAAEFEALGVGDPVWDGAKGKPRPKTEAERNAPEPLSGMEGLYAELARRKAQGKPDPITTDELLGMFERVQAGEVRG